MASEPWSGVGRRARRGTTSFRLGFFPTVLPRHDMTLVMWRTSIDRRNQGDCDRGPSHGWDGTQSWTSTTHLDNLSEESAVRRSIKLLSEALGVSPVLMPFAFFGICRAGTLCSCDQQSALASSARHPLDPENKPKKKIPKNPILPILPEGSDRLEKKEKFPKSKKSK